LIDCYHIIDPIVFLLLFPHTGHLGCDDCAFKLPKDKDMELRSSRQNIHPNRSPFPTIWGNALAPGLCMPNQYRTRIDPVAARPKGKRCRDLPNYNGKMPPHPPCSAQRSAGLSKKRSVFCDLVKDSCNKQQGTAAL